MGTTLDLEELDGTFGAVVKGIEIRNLDDGTWNALHEAWLEYGLLIFPGQFLTKDEQNAFAERFGLLEFPAAPISNMRKGKILSHPDDDVVKSNKGNMGWHHDSTYMPLQAKGAVFTAEIIPSAGAETGFADMRAAYEALDDATRDKIADMQAYHSLLYSNGRMGYLPKEQEGGGYAQYGMSEQQSYLRPLVKVHPETGKPNLLVGRHAYGVVGMEEDESLSFLDGLNEFACQAPRTYHHEWTVGDAVVWDNRRLMHRATPFDMTEPRRMWHTRIRGELSSEKALNVSEEAADRNTTRLEKTS